MHRRKLILHSGCISCNRSSSAKMSGLLICLRRCARRVGRFALAFLCEFEGKETSVFLLRMALVARLSFPAQSSGCNGFPARDVSTFSRNLHQYIFPHMKQPVFASFTTHDTDISCSRMHCTEQVA